MSLDDLVKTLIPAAVIFADAPEHVADLRARAKKALEAWVLQTANQFWDANDPVAPEDDVRELAVSHDWSPDEVYEVLRSSSLPLAFAVCWNTPDEDLDARLFETREEANAFIAARAQRHD